MSKEWLIDMTTDILPILDIGMYETNISPDDIMEEYLDDYKKCVVDKALNKINEILSEDSIVELIGKCEATMGQIISPRFYNYTNDFLEFLIELKDSTKLMNTVHDILRTEKEEFFKWCERNHGSYDGFVSFAPTEEKRFMEYLELNHEDFNFSRAIALVLDYIVMLNIGQEELDRQQVDFEDSVNKTANKNGWRQMEDDYND